MFSTRISSSLRRFVYCLAVTIVAATVVALINRDLTTGKVSAQDGPTVESPAADFPGSGFGNIPDSGTGCGTDNAPGDLPIAFNVTGLSAPLTDVRVSMTGFHSWNGDLVATLHAPGGSPSFTLFSRRGAATAVACGSSNDFGGPYSFFDSAAATDFFSIAGNPTPAGEYRTSASLTGAVTTMNPAFTGLTTGQINGTWTLRVRDTSGGDTGNISAATLTLTGAVGPTPTPTPTPPDALADYDGDGLTDYSVIRALSGPSGQATWHTSLNATGAPSSRDWGLASDTFVPADYDGDGKDDIAVWRSGVQGTFYIIRSSDNTIRVDDFGLAGDDASVVGDYNNDGTDDLAVYRSGTTPGSLSFWYWKSGGTIFAVQWGLHGDFVAPGDYDGDGARDYVVQRANEGNSDYYFQYSSGIPSVVTTFGLANDLVVPGDYDGDLKTDICGVRTVGADWLWSYRKSSDSTDVSGTWGLHATDIPAPGDYDGDGKADFAVWRFGALSTFFVLTADTHHIFSRQWGLNDDNPVTMTYTH